MTEWSHLMINYLPVHVYAESCVISAGNMYWICWDRTGTDKNCLSRPLAWLPTLPRHVLPQEAGLEAVEGCFLEPGLSLKEKKNTERRNTSFSFKHFKGNKPSKKITNKIRKTELIFIIFPRFKTVEIRFPFLCVFVFHSLLWLRIKPMLNFTSKSEELLPPMLHIISSIGRICLTMAAAKEH